jgi:hypothetical protein
MSPNPDKPKRNFFWPDVSTLDGAHWAARQAAHAAAFVAVATGIAATLALLGVQFVKMLGINGWSLVDAGIFAIVAFYLYKDSRVAAWTGLVLFVVERVFMLMTVPAARTGPVMAIAFILAFVGGVRGTMSLHRLKQTPPPGQLGRVA